MPIDPSKITYGQVTELLAELYGRVEALEEHNRALHAALASLGEIPAVDSYEKGQDFKRALADLKPPGSER